MRKRIKIYLWNVLIGVDQLVNALTYGFPDETFSSRTYRKAEAGQWFWRLLRRIINMIFFSQRNHCREAYESELIRRHLPSELRQADLEDRP